MTHSPSPILQNERADILDILRGLALLGVMLDNLFGFTGWGFLTQPQREALTTWPVDAILSLSELSFINGKFYSLFSLLFGIGFSIILIRNEQKGTNPLRVFYRRLFILSIIGTGHLLLLLEGDILFLYALIGMLLPLFRKCSNKAILTWVVVLIASPILFDVLSILFQYKNGGFLEDIAKLIDKRRGIPADDSFNQYLYSKTNAWQHWRNWQASGFLYRYSYILDSNRIPKVLAMFLLGFYAGRKMMYANLENYSFLFKKLRRWGFIIGIPAALACTYFEIFGKRIPDIMGLAHSFFYAISVVPLCLAYISVICLRWINKKGNSRLRFLAPVGRMALTNYLLQTIFGIAIYYGVGFGLGGNIGPLYFMFIGLCVYALQIAYSNWWFNHFNYGPVEWVWRQLTYGKKLSIKKQTQ